jgi:hypothetical protein
MERYQSSKKELRAFYELEKYMYKVLKKGLWKTPENKVVWSIYIRTIKNTYEGPLLM